jgi:hypothetical protein
MYRKARVPSTAVLVELFRKSEMERWLAAYSAAAYSKIKMKEELWRRKFLIWLWNA